MGKKIELNLCANYNSEEFKNAVVNGILCYYAIEKLGLTIKRFQKDELDMFYIFEEYKDLIIASENITYASIFQWGENKHSCFMRLMEIVDKLDELATNSSLIERGSVVDSFNLDCINFGLELYSCRIDRNTIDLSKVQIKEEFIDSCVKEILTVDEGQFLSDISTMKIEITPLDTNKYRNCFIEKKLNKLNNLSQMAENVLNHEFSQLEKELTHSFSRLYKVIHGLFSDSEKGDEARKIFKFIPPHRKVLDKLENKLVDANELKRQLTVHKNKLGQAFADKELEVASHIEENPYDKEAYTFDMDALTFVTEDYYNKIKYSIERINACEEEISRRYSMLDRVEVSIKGAIPSESEMKRYSALSFKFQDLYTRLELAKSQINKDDKDFRTAIKTAITGLGVLLNLTIEGKDVFMRNTLMGGVFNSVNSVYDVVDDKNKSIELSKIKFVTTRLQDYANQNVIFLKDLQTYRHVCNNVIRDVAILMGKPFNLDGMIEIIDTIDLAIQQIESLKEGLDKNHKEQSQLLCDILNI